MNKQQIIDHNPFIIAEIGSNFTTIQDCKTSIWEAKNAGAHAAKFQLFTHTELYGYMDSNEPLSDSLVLNGILPRDWVPDLRRECKKANIHFMCSAFSLDGYKFINEHVDIHKLASSELTNIRIVDYLATTKKPILFSTGGSTLDEVKFIYNRLGKEAIPMYCVANYPAREIDLLNITKLRRQLNETPIGFSDHSVDVLNIPSWAYIEGAKVIEKHFTAIPHIKTPDQPHSLNPQQFKQMISSIKQQTRSDSVCWVPEEQEFILKHKRRLLVTKNIKAGDILIENQNYAALRSKFPDTRGASALAVEYFHGKKANKEIKAFTGLALGDIDV